MILLSAINLSFKFKNEGLLKDSIPSTNRPSVLLPL